MITMRSLLRAAVAAFWTSWKRQRLNSRRLILRSERAFLAEIFRRGCDGRTLDPRRRALRMSRFARTSESDWHTTRVLPAGLALSAERSERSFGTFPPAAGETP